MKVLAFITKLLPVTVQETAQKVTRDRYKSTNSKLEKRSKKKKKPND